MLKNGLALLFSCALFALSSGCIKMEHTIHFRSDGTATYTLAYSISDQAIVQFHAMEKLKNQLALATGEPSPGIEMDPLLHLFLDPDEDAIRAALSKYKEDGMVIKELSVKNGAAKRSVDLKLEFSDLSKIAQTDFFQNNGFNLSKDQKGNYVFSREPYINRPGEIAKLPSKEEVKQLIPLLSGFKTTIRISVPGNILSTTAFHNSNSSASWSFDFDHNPGALVELQHQPFRIVFKAPETKFPEMHYRGSSLTK